MATLGIPFTLVHLNEMDRRLADFVGDRAACIVAESTEGQYELLIGSDELAALDGDVGECFAPLRSRLASLRW